MTREKAIAWFEFLKKGFVNTEYEEYLNLAITALSAEGELTNEKAIAFLQDNGWLVEHDRIMTSGSAEGEYIKKEDAIEAINNNIADFIPRFIGRQVEIPLRLASAINKIPVVSFPDREKGTKNCRDCVEWKTCPCGEEGHTKGTSIGCSIGECKDFKSADREKGEWIPDHTVFTKCSCCGWYMRTTCFEPYRPKSYHFCPNCGADMRGKANEDSN